MIVIITLYTFLLVKNQTKSTPKNNSEELSTPLTIAQRLSKIIEQTWKPEMNELEDIE